MNYKKIYLLLSVVLSAWNAFSQYTMSGNVQEEESNENMELVSIYFSELKKGTTTNSQGNYEIKDVRPGTYLVEVSAFGYKSVIQSIQITKDTTINFSLSNAVHELNEVVITGVSRFTELKLSPVIIKTVDKNIFNQNSSTNLIDALKNVPGISQITTGAGISKPVIRGLGYNRVISLNNGIKQEGQQWGDEHGIEIDEYGVDRIEIVKGPGSLMYGSDGIAGVLNFLVPKSPPNETVKTQIIANYQSNNNLFGYSLFNSGNKKGVQWQARFSNKWAGDYSNKLDGKVLNSGFREMNGSVMVGINKRWGHSHVTVSSWNNLLNLPEGERDSLGQFIFENVSGETVTATKSDYKGYRIGTPHQVVNHLSVASNNYFLLKKGTLAVDLAYQNNKRKEFGNPTNPEEIELFFNLSTFNYSLRYNLEKVKGWETSVGVSGMQQSNSNKGEEFLIPAYQLLDVGAFVFTQKTFDKITFAGGLRIDNRTLHSKELFLDTIGQPTTSSNPFATEKFARWKRNFVGISASVGLSYQINNSSTLKFNISRGFRAPNSAELSSNGKHEGSFRYEIGNTQLKPEASHQIDVAYFLNLEHVSFEITPFVNFISNYIYIEKLQGATGLDSIVDPSEPAPAFKFKSGNTLLYGGEFYMDIHPHPLDWLHIENSFSLVQAMRFKQPDSMMFLPFIPAPKYRGEVKVEFKKVGKILSGTYVKFGVDYYFPKNNIFSAYQTESKTPGYTLLNVGIGTNIKAFNRPDFFSLFVSGNNLANVAYQSHLSRLKYAPENLATGRTGIYNMGRNFSVKLIINI